MYQDARFRECKQCKIHLPFILSSHRTFIDGSKIIKWIFRKWDVAAWIGSSWLRIGTGGGLL
jgi:hypothetical protein